MSRIDERRLLPATAVLAVLVTASQLFLAQSAGASSVSTAPSQQPAASPASLPEAQHPAAAANAPETPEETGDRLLAEKKFQAAIDAYKKAPHDSPTVWNMMGIAYQQMFSNDEAIRCYFASLKLNPESASVLNNLGTVYASLQDYRGAERYYRKALKLDPKSAPTSCRVANSGRAGNSMRPRWPSIRTSSTGPLACKSPTQPPPQTAAP
jgi:tetratricopeptide (TPR) repeat protein